MGDNRTYLPGIHCAVCIAFGRNAAATKTAAASDGREYQLCDTHCRVLDTHGDYATAIYKLRPTTKGSV